MSLIAHVVQTEHCTRSPSTLDRQHVFLGVGNTIAREVVGKPTDRLELRKVCSLIGMLRTGPQRCKLKRERLAKILAGGERDERVGKLRRSRARVGCTVRRIRAHDANANRFARGIEYAITGADTGLSGITEIFGKHAISLKARKVSQA